MSNKMKIVLAALVVLLAAASRLADHPFNFTPVAAMAIFAGSYLRSRWGIVLPLAAMLVSDYFIGFYEWPVMVAVYASFALAFGLGRYIQGKKWQYVPAAALASSILFFLITNFAVWAFFDWYPHTSAGLAAAFTMALPFFRNTIAGDLVYTGAFFGAYEAALYFASVRFTVKTTA
jgi:hypothetical protein